MSAIWLIRVGNDSSAISQALQDKIVGIGWGELGNLIKISDKAEYGKYFQEIYHKKCQYGDWQAWTFKNDIRTGDYAILPDKNNGVIYITQINGDYQFKAENHHLLQHFRKVKDFKKINRVELDSSFKYAIGSFLTVSKVDSQYYDYVKNLFLGTKNIENNKLNDIEFSDDGQEERKINIIERSSDEITEFLFKKLQGHGMVDLISELLRLNGYSVEHKVVKINDGNADLLCGKGYLGIESERTLVQVKTFAKTKVSINEIHKLCQTVKEFGADYGLYVSWSGFSFEKTSLDYRKSYYKIQLWEAQDIVNLLTSNYDILSDEWRRRIPLKKIYVLEDL